MDSLDALSNILSSIAEQPYNVTLHAQHIQLAQSDPALNPELESSLEMMTEFLAADPGHVWLPLIHEKQKKLVLYHILGVEELLALYERAVRDYLCEYITHEYSASRELITDQLFLYYEATCNLLSMVMQSTMASIRRRDLRNLVTCFLSNGRGKG